MSEFKVLIIEDDEDIGNSVKYFLERNLQLSCEYISNAESAIYKLVHDSYDIIISDYKLPGISGMELINRLRDSSKYNQTPIIMMSGFFKEIIMASDENRFENVTFFEKPFEVDEFVRHIKLMLPRLAA